MGVDHEVYVIPASKYMKLIRPHLIKYYGRANIHSIIRQETRRKQSANIIQAISKHSFSMMFNPSLPLETDDKVLTIRKFIRSEQADSFKGYQDDFQKIEKIIKKESVFMDELRCNFLRQDQYLGTIDRFGDQQIKVCNHLNIENFLTYIAVVKGARRYEVNRLKMAGLVQSESPNKKVEPQKEDKENSRDGSDEDSDSDSDSETPKKKVKSQTISEKISQSEPSKEKTEKGFQQISKSRPAKKGLFNQMRQAAIGQLFKCLNVDLESKRRKYPKNSEQISQQEHLNKNEEKSETFSEEDSQQEPEVCYKKKDLEDQSKAKELKQMFYFVSEYSGVYSTEKMFKQAFKVMKKSKEQMYLVFRSL